MLESSQQGHTQQPAQGSNTAAVDAWAAFVKPAVSTPPIALPQPTIGAAVLEQHRSAQAPQQRSRSRFATQWSTQQLIQVQAS